MICPTTNLIFLKPKIIFFNCSKTDLTFLYKSNFFNYTKTDLIFLYKSNFFTYIKTDLIFLYKSFFFIFFYFLFYLHKNRSDFFFTNLNFFIHKVDLNFSKKRGYIHRINLLELVLVKCLLCMFNISFTSCKEGYIGH